MSFPEILSQLSDEEIQMTLDQLREQIQVAKQKNKLEDMIRYALARNEVIAEQNKRLAAEEGGAPAPSRTTMSVNNHYAIQVLRRAFPGDKNEELLAKCEEEVRTLWNETASVPRWPASEEKENWPAEVRFSLDGPTPAVRPIVPLFTIHAKGDEVAYVSAAPPINVWWRAEDRCADRPRHSWSLVWREWRDDMIHEAWIHRYAENGDGCDFAHYLTRYPGGTTSPLPLP
jgi:hypothetical protein